MVYETNNLRRDSDKLTKEEDHDPGEHHREFVRLTHGIGDGNDLWQTSNVIRRIYGIRPYQTYAFEGEYRSSVGQMHGNMTPDHGKGAYPISSGKSFGLNNSTLAMPRCAMIPNSLPKM